jgi:FkbM family methyltransferase
MLPNVPGQIRAVVRGKVRGLRSLARIAPNLREPLRFSARQIARRTGVRSYTLRGSRVAVCIRHSTADVITMEEVLAERQYEPPPPLRGLVHPAGEPLEVADLGANVGLFSAWLLSRRPDARIVAFEPDPANLAVLEECVRRNDRTGHWRVVPACAAAADGQVRFVAGDFAVSHIAAPGEDDGAATMLPAVDVFPHIGGAGFVKMDIEGGEWAILADPRFRSLAATALVLEYHPHLCPDPDPRGYVDRLLEAAGWTVQHTEFDRPGGHGVLWAWK